MPVKREWNGKTAIAIHACGKVVACMGLGYSSPKQEAAAIGQYSIDGYKVEIIEGNAPGDYGWCKCFRKPKQAELVEQS